MPGWSKKRSSRSKSRATKKYPKKRSSKRSYKKKRGFTKRKSTYARRPTVGAKKKRLMKKTVKIAQTADCPESALGVMAGYGDAARNGAIGSWTRAKGSSPFSDRFFYRDKWTQQFPNVMFVGTPAWTPLSLRANSIFDPNYYTGLSQNSAQYYLQIGQIYLNYRVHACSIKLDIDVGAGGDSQEIVVCLWPSIVPPTTAGVMPQSLAMNRLINNVKMVSVHQTQDDGITKHLSHYMKIGDLLGIPDISVDQNFSGNFTNPFVPQSGTNPAANVYWMVQAWYTNALAAPAQHVNIGCTLKFDVEAYNLVPDTAFNAGPSLEEEFEDMKVVYPQINTSIPSSTAATTGGT